MDVCGTAVLENRQARQATPAYSSYHGESRGQTSTDELLRELAFVLQATRTVRRAMHADGMNIGADS